MSTHPPHQVAVPLPPAIYTLRQCSGAVRVALAEHEAGRSGQEEALRAAYDALREEHGALVYQLQVRELHARRDVPAWPPTYAERVAVLGRLVLENQRLGARLQRVLAAASFPS